MSRSVGAAGATWDQTGPPSRLAILDLGSTTFQLLVADVDTDGTLVPIIRDRVTLNLAAALREARIPPDVARRAAEIVLRHRTVAERAGAQRIVPLATSVLREAPNRADLAEILEAAAGVPIRFIDGREEARLMFAGIRASVALGAGATLFLDLGGGSLEVAIAEETLRWGESTPLGAGRLTAGEIRNDPPSRRELARVRATVEAGLARLEPAVRAARPVRCVASGGTAGAIARILAARRWSSPPESLNGFSFGIDEIEELAEELAALPLRERLKVPGVDDRRATLLPAGSVILATAGRTLGVATLTHSEWGLREGAVLDEVGLADLPTPAPRELRRRAVARLLRVWSEDRDHVELVARTATRLFDATAPIHRLGGRERELLIHAGLLHDIGARVSPDRSHKHGAYLVEHAGLRGFSPEEIAVMASIVRFQRGRPPRPAYGPYEGLPQGLRHAVRVSAGVLRIAHALARGGPGDVEDLEVALGPEEVRLRVHGPRNPEGAVAEARIESELLSRVLEAEIRIQVGSVLPRRAEPLG